MPAAHAQTLPRIGQINHLPNLVPDERAMFDVDRTMYDRSPEDIPAELKQRLESQFQLSIQTIFETLFLHSGLYEKFETQQKSLGRDELIERLKEKSDKLGLTYDIENVGKAELILLGRGKYQMPVTMIRLNSGRYVMFLDKSLYDPEMFKQEIPKDLPQNEIDLEMKLRSIAKGLVHGLVSEILIFGKKGGPHIPLYKIMNPQTTQEDIREQLTEEIRPLADRYSEIEEDLLKVELTDREREKLLAEREVIEENVLKLQKNKDSFLGKMVVSGAVNMSAGETGLGLPITVIYHNQGQFIGRENLERPHEDTLKDSIHKWATYAKANYESIHIDWDPVYKEKGIKKLKVFMKGDLYFQYLNVPWQVVLALASGYMLTFVTDNAPNWAALGMNSLFIGLLVGLNIRTFLKWSFSGTELSKSLKDTSVGILFGITAYMFDPAKSLSDVALITWASIIGSQFLKNLVKKGPREYQAFKRRSGQTRGELATPIERQYLQWWGKNGKPIGNYEVKIPFKLVRSYLEKAGILRTEKIGEVPREIRKDSMLSTEMILKTFIPKTMSTFSILLFPVYALIGPYWEYESVKDKERVANEYAKQHGANTPKSKAYQEEAQKARKQWENYTILDKYTFAAYGFDLSKLKFMDSKIFEYGVVVPSRYLGYYVTVYSDVMQKIEALLKDVWLFMTYIYSKKSNEGRIQKYVGISLYKLKVRQKEKQMRSRNIINMNYPLKRETAESLRQRREVYFAPANCMGYFR